MLKKLVFLFPLLALACQAKKTVDDTGEKLCGRYLLKAYGLEGNYTYHHQDTTFEINPYQPDGEYWDLVLMQNQRKMIGAFHCEDNLSYVPRIFIKDIDDGDPQTLFEGGPGFYMSALSLSRNDSLVAFTVTKPDTIQSQNYSSKSYSSIYVLDIASKKIIYKTPMIHNSEPSLYAEQNSWELSLGRFVFTNGLLQSYDTMDSSYFLPQGIFICDIKKDELISISNHGWNAIWSNSGKAIAYIRNDDIVLYKIDDKTSTIIYKEKSAENINSIHWNPCIDDELFIVSWLTTNPLAKSGHTVEQVLNVKTGSLAQRKTIDIGENSISWVK